MTVGTLIPDRKMSWGGMVRRVKIHKSGTGVTSASFRVHLYKGSTPPTVTNGDNGAWLSSGYDKYLGSVDVTVDKIFSDGAAGHGTPTVGSEVVFDCNSGQKIYYLVEARAAYPPAANEAFTVSAEVLLQ